MRLISTFFVTLLIVSTVQAREFTRIELEQNGQVSAFYMKGQEERVCNVEIHGVVGSYGQYSVLKQGHIFSSSKVASGTAFATRLASGVGHLISEDILGDLLDFAKTGSPDDVLTQEAAGVVSMIKELCD